MTTFELPGCIDMWTVKSEREEEEKEQETKEEGQNEEGEKGRREKEEKGTGQHDYLILSRSDSTMVSQYYYIMKIKYIIHCNSCCYW